MGQIGWSLVGANGAEVQFWGDTPGVCAGIPTFIRLPNGDDVHCPAPGELQEWKLLPRMFETGEQSLTSDGTSVIVRRPAQVPQSVPMWKAKTILQQSDKLTAADTAVTASGNRALQFAWGPNGASEIRRDSPAISAMATAIGLSSAEVDALFIAAAAIEV